MRRYTERSWEELLQKLPPAWDRQHSRTVIADHLSRDVRKVLVLDDDPTGTQTVYDVPVYTRLSEEAFRQALLSEHRCSFFLTNSRSLSEEQAVELNRQAARALLAAHKTTGVPFVVVSRSDSTLRGHFPAETDALLEVLGRQFRYDGLILMPFFAEGGRLTCDDVHWVKEGDRLLEAAATPFAQDPTFGYGHSDLKLWVEEKTKGQVGAEQVVAVALEDIRCGGPQRIREMLEQVRAGQVVIVNAVDYSDAEAFVAGLLMAETGGKAFLYRTAASFVRCRIGQAGRPLLSPAVLSLPGGGAGGLVVVGSYVPKSTRQLERLLQLPGTVGLEVPVRQVLDEMNGRPFLDRLAKKATADLHAGHTVVIFTSRELVDQQAGLSHVEIASRVSSALVRLVQMVGTTPRFLIAKGGITSSDLATRALGVQRAVVLGQIRPGIPVWRLGEESKVPGLSYIVFPGNVGDDETLADVVKELG